jgi:hypothetical protein
MKVWIDKQGGTHYHKENCKMIGKPFRYEEIEHRVRTFAPLFPHEYREIIVDNRRYHPCPMCFGEKR